MTLTDDTRKVPLRAIAQIDMTPKWKKGEMLKSKNADLWFGSTHQPVGFSNPALSIFDGSAEPVVRELIQNSLDAARQAGRSPEVKFEICEIPDISLPGWESYKNALRMAKREHKKQTSPDKSMVLKRIQKIIDHHRNIPVLLCIDNGHGLDGGRMDSLLTPGMTSKGQGGGAGSYGLGHHAAFSASNLRYVLYASKYRNKQGKIAQICSGHAILATHRKAGDKQIFAADGYWGSTGQTRLAFDGSDSNYPSTPPRLLAGYLDQLDDTGTVVCVAGFNDFHRDKGDTSSVDAIAQVAAANFSDAIRNGGMKITVTDRRSDTAAECQVTASNVLPLLRKNSKKKRSPRGTISEHNAYQAALTLEEGEWVKGSPSGVIIRWRFLADQTQQDSQVHIFRKGMWITSRADHLLKRNFSKTKPFDAVVSLNHGTLEQLVRNAEGPEHRGLDKKRLETSQKKQLKELLIEIAELIHGLVGERDDIQDYTPPGFAVLKGQLNRKGERTPRVRRSAGGGSVKNPVLGGKKKGSKINPPNNNKNVPRGGTIPKYLCALRLVENNGVIETEIEYQEKPKPEGRIGVRVLTVSGSDGSCENPLKDTYLPIKRIEYRKGFRLSNGDNDSGDVELSVPVREGAQFLRIYLCEPVTEPDLVQIEIVKRQPLKSTSSIMAVAA